MSFEEEVENNIQKLSSDESFKKQSMDWLIQSADFKYSYNFRWMGIPIIQYPQDIVAIQEIIWSVKPDLIIETGIAHGGSLVLSASILELIGENGIVVGVDIDIRPHNREKIENHPMSKRIKLVEGSSVDNKTVDIIKSYALKRNKVLVFLDSNHTHEHVLRELELYSPLVTQDSYIVVFDTVVEDMPDNSFPERPWGKGNNPKTAVFQFLKSNKRFEIDYSIHNKLQLTVAPEGFLKCLASYD